MEIWLESDVTESQEISGITRDEFTRIEQEIGKIIPASYKEVLLQQNGGPLQYRSVRVADPAAEVELLEIDHLLGIETDGNLSSDYLIEEWGLRGDILVISGDGNGFFVLDYGEDAQNPPVIYLEVDSEVKVRVANHFDDFLSRLIVEAPAADSDDENWRGVTQEEAERVFFGTDVAAIEEMLLNLMWPEDHEWYFTNLLKLSRHDDLFVRQAVTNILDNNMKIYKIDADEKWHPLLNKTITNLLQDSDPDIRAMAKDIAKSSQ
ncbi:MAG: SMI1/KNR4 family protein [Bacillota bacterium]